MKLYHFTGERQALQVALNGLQPNAPDDHAWQTLGEPVVWLTRDESNLTRPEHLAHFQRINCADLCPAIGATLFGGHVRCVVEIERHNKKLMRWTEFLRTNKRAAADETGKIIETGPGLLQKVQTTIEPGCLKNWWVYRGVIPAHKIFVPTTARIALLGLKPDAPQRAELEAMAPDDPVLIAAGA